MARGQGQGSARRGGPDAERQRARARQPQTDGDRVQIEPGTHVNRTPRGAGAYPDEFAPVARAGDVVELIGLQKFRVVERVHALPTIMAFDARNSNGVTVNANTTNDDNEATNLGQESNVLAQLRMFNPRGAIGPSILARVDQGGANTPLYKTKNYIGQVDQSTEAVLASGVTELYVFEDQNNPFFTFINTAGSSRNVNDLAFAGFQFRLNDEDLTQIPSQVQPVPLPVATGL